MLTELNINMNYLTFNPPTSFVYILLKHFLVSFLATTSLICVKSWGDAYHVLLYMCSATHLKTSPTC